MGSPSGVSKTEDPRETFVKNDLLNVFSRSLALREHSLVLADCHWVVSELLHLDANGNVFFRRS